jgi:hypothetical protein
MAIKLKTQHITNMYTPIELATTNMWYAGGHGGTVGGVTDHGYLHGLADNDHPQYLLTRDATGFISSVEKEDWQYVSDNSLSLGTGALVSLFYTSNSSDLIAVSNSTLFAISNHTHTNSGLVTAALSDHSHGPLVTAVTAGSNVSVNSASTGATIYMPAYITTAYGAAIQGSGTYNQNTGTIQFSNANGLTFGLNTNGVMTAQMEYPDQVGILGIWDGVSSLQTNSSMQFANSNGLSFGFNGSTMTASYTVPGNTVFSNSNNVEFGLSGSTITALALFEQTTQSSNIINGISILNEGNTAGELVAITSGSLYLFAGEGILLAQIDNTISIVGNTGGNYISIGGNTSGTLTEISSGTVTVAGGNNITLSQDGNAYTIIGADQGGVQTGISGIGASNATYTSGSVIFSGQNNITVGSYVSSNSQYVRLSVGNYLLTAAQVSHTHGSNVFTTSTSGVDIKISSSSNGMTMAVPAYITAALTGGSFAGTSFSTISTGGDTSATNITGTLGTNGLTLVIPKYITTAPGISHTHGSNVSLSLTNVSGAVSSASNGITLSMTGYPASSFVNVSQTGNIYFINGVNISWSSSTSGNSTTILATAGGGNYLYIADQNSNSFSSAVSGLFTTVYITTHSS